MAQQLRDGELQLTDLADSILRQARQRHPSTSHVLLIADQFEELFTLCPDPSTRRAFLDLLLPLTPNPMPNTQYPIPHAATPDAPLSLLLSLRADFTAQALGHRALADGIQSGRLVLGPMTRQELRRAIEEPARGRGVVFQPGLVERLLDDVGDEPGNLPLLQFTLTQLWGRQTDGQLTHAAYEQIGGLAGALTRYADGVYQQLSSAEQEDARRVFTRLVRPGEGPGEAVPSPDTHRLASRDELNEGDWRLVQRLTDARLLVTGREPGGQEMVELAHEALIQHWRRLRGWMDTDRAFYTWRGRLRAALRQWEASDRDEGALLRGAPLAEAEGWLARREAELSLAGREFIQASLARRDEQQRVEEERRQRELAQAQALAEAEYQRAETEARAGRRLRWLVAGLSVVFLLAVGSALLARNAQGKAQRAAKVSQSLNLATSAQLALAEHNTDLALALAVEANRLPDPPPQAQLMLAEAAYAPGTRRIFLGHDGPVEDVAIAPGGRMAFSASADQTLILWDISTTLNAGLDTGEMIRRFSGHSEAVHAVVFLPGGDQALSASADGTLILWDIESGGILRRFTEHSDGVWDVAVSPDGRTALSGAADHTLILWNIETGEVIRRFIGHEGAVLSVAISPDGDTALSGSADRSVILWDIKSGEIRQRMSGVADTVTGAQQAIGHYDAVWGVAFLPDGHSALSVSQDEHAILWDISTGLNAGISAEPVPSTSSGQALSKVEGPVLSRSPERSEGAVEGLNAGIESGEGRVLLDVSPQAVRSVAFSPDGQFLVAGLAKGQASNPDYSLRLLETETGREIRRLVGHREVVADVAFSPDGKRILSSSTDSNVILWDATSGAEIHRLVGHTGGVLAVAFHPEGRLAVSGAADGSLLLWDVAEGMALRRYVGLSKPIVGLAFVPGGGSFLVADDAVHEWRVDATQDDLLAWVAANRYLPELTCQQRQRYRIEPLCDE